MNRFLHIIADYGINDPAFGEVIQKFKKLKPNLDIYPTSVPPFSTIATGFWIAQFALVNPFPNLIIFSNTAPRGDENEIYWHGDERQVLLFAKLKNGVPVFAINSGFSFSFIKEEIVELYKVNVSNNGSQFRSRDYYPDAVVEFLNGKDIRGERIPIEYMPNRPTNRIAWIDGYGNLKTTIRQSEFTNRNQQVKIKINGATTTVNNVLAGAEIKNGDLGIYAGSSGAEDPFIEIFVRGSSAAATFNNAPVESTINII